MKRDEIRIRDPYVFTDGESKTYYMYGTTDFTPRGAGNKFSVYVSKDLENFDGPFSVFDGEKSGFWATRNYWAAEVYRIGRKYYLFGSFKAEGCARATQILVSDSPLGAFRPVSEKPQTPEGWECLDGTLYTENGTPYLVFCHEWLQCGIGEIWAVELNGDLSAAQGEPFLLFRASDNPEVGSIKLKTGEEGMVTDGPFLFKEKGKIKMIWSSFCNGRYVVLEAVAESIRGKWTHLKSRFSFDGGHAMVFSDLSGKRYFALHAPNTSPDERAVFIPYDEV